MTKKIVQVAVEAPLSQALTYRIELDSSSEQVRDLRGTSVRVPLGKRKADAVILGDGTENLEFQLKNIESFIEERPVLPEKFLTWAEWLASYYQYPIGQVVALAFPPLPRTSRRRSRKKNPVPTMEQSSPPQLSRQQSACLKGIRACDGFSAHLLHGVTGSGKTEVYLHLLTDVLERGQKAIVLVPEISLTPQLIQRFSARFPGKIAVIHSHLTDREKTDQWWEMIDGEKSILVGARSALFCPVQNLGLIVVDEEHEPSFKQDEKLKYHARDAAVMLAKQHQCPIVMGSATPSLESFFNAREGKYHLHEMADRVSDRQMPLVEVVDMKEVRRARKELPNEQLPFWMSEQLHSEIQQTLERQEQVALFLNRRGVAQTVSCPACGFVEECPNCSIGLTLHGKRHLVCHYCDFSKPFKEPCSSCPDGELQALGIGTELVEQDIAKLFPEAILDRADRDEINSREDLERMVYEMESGKTQILIGTQMIAKGLDFPKLTLVGLILADVGFNLPDFRASERSFQLLTQVAGRAGRHSAQPGRVVVQTYNPAHPSVIFSRTSDYRGFAQQELAARTELHYPPFGRLSSFRIQGLDLRKVEACADELANRAYKLRSMADDWRSVEILGPAPAPIARLRGRYRYHLLIKFPKAPTMSRFVSMLTQDMSWVPAGTKVLVDIDPINLL